MERVLKKNTQVRSVMYAGSGPVIADAAMGETPMFPDMTDVGTLVMPHFVMVTKFAAVPKSTAVWDVAFAIIMNRRMRIIILTAASERYYSVKSGNHYRLCG